MSDRVFPQTYKIFKPKKTSDGAASQWELSCRNDNRTMFVEFANQKKTVDNDRTFDWTNKITMKLAISDIGDILSVLTGMQDGIGPKDGDGRRKGIYHETPKGNTILQLGKKSGAEVSFIRISQRLKGKDPQVATHSITNGEAAVLATLLRRAIEVIHLW